MKKRSRKKSTADTGSKLYRKRLAKLARIAGFGDADAGAEESFEGVLEPRGVLTEGEPTVIGTDEASLDAGMSCPVATPPKTGSAKKTILWIILSFGIAVLSIWAVVSQNKHFSFRFFMQRLADSNKGWLACAFVAMLGFILFEALAFRTILRGLGYRRSLFANYTYAATDIYFSAITPSATGGQPASAYIMMHSGGISGSVTTVTILVCLALYALSIIVLGVFCFAFRPLLYLTFSVPARIMIIIGVAVQFGLAFMFVLLIQRGQLLCKIAVKLLPLAAKLHLVRNPERRAARLQESLNNYRLCAEMTAGKKSMLVKALLFNVLQRASQISVTVFAYLAMGGKVRNAVDIFAIQSYTILGAAYVPIPGGMGVMDMMLSDGLTGYVDPSSDFVATELTLLSRSISFYACIILCGITVLLIYLVQKARGKKVR